MLIKFKKEIEKLTSDFDILKTNLKYFFLENYNFFNQLKNYNRKLNDEYNKHEKEI